MRIEKRRPSKRIVRALLAALIVASGLVATSASADASHSCSVVADVDGPWFQLGGGNSSNAFGDVQVSNGCSNSARWRTELQVNGPYGWLRAGESDWQTSVPGIFHSGAGTWRVCNGGELTLWRARVKVRSGGNSTVWQYRSLNCGA